MKAHFRMFARYNAWANRRVYAAAGAVSDADYRRDRGAFFGSLRGTLNHVLVADRIWMHRFTGRGPTYGKLDLILHDELATLRASREAEDTRIKDWVDSLDDRKLAGPLTYRTITNPADITQPLAAALAHFFNHQTHHRGQVHALLTAAGGREAAPSLDLILFQRETGVGLSA
ncbi:MAG TPA: DinB family protein [Propylenella sp.]